MHGPTFMANPLACAVASASIELLMQGNWRQRVADIEAILSVGLEPAREYPGVKDVRVLGAIGVIELEHPVNMRHATEYLLAKGVWLRPFGRLIYTMPPFIVDESQLRRICDAMLGLVRLP